MRNILVNSRVLFTIQGCPHCRTYAECIGLINAKLPMVKRIRIVDATRFHDYQIADDPLIQMYMPYLQGSYPAFFFGTTKLEGTHTREELNAWLMTALSEDFEIPESSLEFNKDCRWVKKPFIGRKIVCT